MKFITTLQIIAAIFFIGLLFFQFVYPLCVVAYWTVLTFIAKRKFPDNPELRARWLWIKGIEK